MLVALVALAVTTSYVGRLGVGRDHVTAAVRATVQLAVVSLLIAAALDSVWWSFVVVLVMLLVAVATASRRVDVIRSQVPWVGLAIVCGVFPVLALSLGSGVVPLNGAGIIPIAGIVVGNMMTAATLTGRRACDELVGHFGSYEAGLAIGLTQDEAAFEVVQPSAREALLPRARPDPDRGPGHASRSVRGGPARRGYAAGSRLRADPGPDRTDGGSGRHDGPAAPDDRPRTRRTARPDGRLPALSPGATPSCLARRRTRGSFVPTWD